MLKELPHHFSLTEDGTLSFAGLSLRELAQRFGTPLYILDEDQIRAKCRSYHAAFSGYPLYRIAYASKALTNQTICRIMHQEGMNLDVMSGGELYTAVTARFPVEDIWFHGNNKSEDELKYALQVGVGYFVVDNDEEIGVLQALAEQMGKIAKVILRVRPGVWVDTHHKLQTGQDTSKFGIGHSAELVAAVTRVLEQRNLHLVGLHCHIGSQIFTAEAFCKAAEVMMEQLIMLREKLGITLSYLNLGGGYAIQYAGDDEGIAAEQIIGQQIEVIRSAGEKANYPLPTLVIEPGRSIVGPAGITLYTIGMCKSIPSLKRYITVDGGMSDNIRPSLYEAKYKALFVERPLAPNEEVVSLAGKHCETGDILIDSLALTDVHRGEHLVLLSTGAYNYSMASNYNRVPRAAMVLLSHGHAELILRRERYEDITACDVIPEHFAYQTAKPTTNIVTK